MHYCFIVTQLLFSTPFSSLKKIRKNKSFIWARIYHYLPFYQLKQHDTISALPFFVFQQPSSKITNNEVHTKKLRRGEHTNWTLLWKSMLWNTASILGSR